MMKEITLICDKPYAYKCDISVYDYHNDGLRKRCMISAEYSKDDIAELKSKGIKTADEALKVYKTWLEDTIKVLLSCDITIVKGEEELMDIIKKHISDEF